MKRDVGYFYQPRYKEIEEDWKAWNAGFELEGQQDAAELLADSGDGNATDYDTPYGSDEAMNDPELKGIVSFVLHDDGDFEKMHDSVLDVAVKINDMEAELNRSLQAIARVASTTEGPQYTTTVRAYVKGNPLLNSEVNTLLNQLVKYKFEKDVKFLPALREAKARRNYTGAFNFTGDVQANESLNEIFTRLFELGRKNKLQFNDFLANLDNMPVPKKSCPPENLWITMICFSRYINTVKHELEHCCGNQTQSRIGSRQDL